MQEDKEVRDITIIGGGPVGIFAAFYAGLRQASTKILDSLPQLGGQLSALYPEKYIYDVAGFPKIRAQELVDNLVDQMEMFKENTSICLNQAVQSIDRENGVFRIETTAGLHYSRTIIITAGNGAFQPRKLKLEETGKFEGTNVHYFITDLEKFRNKRVVVFGGGDSAVDWALMLEPIAEKVTVVHRRDKFRAHEHSVELLKNSSAEILTPFNPIELKGDNRVEEVVLQEAKGDRQVNVPVDDVLINYGFISSLGPILDWDLNIEKNSIVTNSKMETNIEGIYAAGDITTYPGKVKLIASGFGEATTAVSNAKVFIDPTARVQSLHSTTIMEKREREDKQSITT
ncbi:NAD(P)/FAD-dependent oxidoreductase [Siminovitchia acidinfaciens]|uniref:Ferredoxin--NADP reductase n=1 Tax=Siminovitchia acidinfaciens TaxID=2321395 RepID=A0A429Y711_9BACI|nr:NAD(P)/FAD-dependent oxidoreductase [Siminovitchia acidinfaciens]RST77239.1 NAD(P)/FAD-dependent oxidoreductase [Siminovitchia acidinfaciens]